MEEKQKNKEKQRKIRVYPVHKHSINMVSNKSTNFI